MDQFIVQTAKRTPNQIIESSYTLRILGSQETEIIDEPVLVTNCLHRCYSHAVVDGIFEIYSILKKHYGEFKKIRLFIPKTVLFTEHTSNRALVIGDTYKGVWGELISYVTDKPLIFEHLVKKTTQFNKLIIYCQDDTVRRGIKRGIGIPWQLSPWNTKSVYRERNVPTAVFPDSEIFDSLLNFRNMIFNIHSIIPKNTRDLIIIDRPDKRKFDTEVLLKLQTEASKNTNWNYKGTYILENYSHKEQILLFSSCKFFIFRHGSCLTNLLWCPGQSVVFDIDDMAHRKTVISRLVGITNTTHYYLNYKSLNINKHIFDRIENHS